ncbi:MAG: hypothetical protein LBG27_14660 [Spirochaetaceae bacterium]|jgi:opacity protein-like surface antigen|nr:hypothetical protein [Spirochaetaceae bacterium]
MCSKRIFLAVSFFLLAAALFAVDFGITVGGGAILGGNFTSSETDPTDLMGGAMKMTLSYDTSTFDAGAFIFADATYAELAVAYIAEIGTVTGESITTILGTDPIEEDYVSHVLIVDLLGKYPIILNDRLIVFPALGIGVKLPFAGNDNSDKEHAITWGITAKAGAGLDFALSERLSLRGEALFSYQFISDRDATIEFGPPLGKNDFKFKESGYNFGPQVKIGLGYKIL